MRAIAALLLAVLTAYAQSVVDPAHLSERLRKMAPDSRDKPLVCTVTAIPPALNYSLRIQAGYRVQVPMHQYFGPGHGWVQLVRVTPEGGNRRPIYLGYRTRLPDVPENRADVEIGGGYLLGEGTYDVSWEMFDDSGRVCRSGWRVKARLKGGERKVKSPMAPDTVAAFSLLGGKSGALPDSSGQALRLTVLLHAAPLSPRRTHFREMDRMLLLGALSALREQLPGAAVRVVAFNLDKQKEIYRQDDFQAEMMPQVERAMDSLELDLTDVHTLEHPEGHIDLLASLVNAELRADPSPDAVLFFGPRTRFEDRPPRFEAPPGGIPHFFALQFRAFPRYPAAVVPDAIANTVSSLKGKVMTIHTPAEFASVIAMLRRAR